LTRVVLIVPANPWGYMVEDIVSFAIKIVRGYGVDIEYTVLYSIDESRAIISIDGKDIVYGGNQLPSVKDIVDLVIIASTPLNTLSRDNDSGVYVET